MQNNNKKETLDEEADRLNQEALEERMERELLEEMEEMKKLGTW